MNNILCGLIDFISLSTFAYSQCLQDYHIVSDFDDTIKTYTTHEPTDFDIALNEVQEQRLTIESAVKVGLSVIKSSDNDIIAPYAFCPITKIELIDNDVLSKIKFKVLERINSICSKRLGLNKKLRANF